MSRARSKGKDLFSCVFFFAYTSGSSLKNVYKKHVKRLCRTGEGTEETLLFYIMGDGPCVETPPHAVNIWSAWLTFYLSIIWPNLFSRANRGGVSFLTCPSPYPGLLSKCHSHCHYHSSWTTGLKDGRKPR